MQPLLASMGAAAALVGAFGLVWVRRRRFRRRNAQGAEVFRGYGHMLVVRTVDSTITCTAGLLLCAGGAVAMFCLLHA